MDSDQLKSWAKVRRDIIFMLQWKFFEMRNIAARDLNSTYYYSGGKKIVLESHYHYRNNETSSAPGNIIIHWKWYSDDFLGLSMYHQNLEPVVKKLYLRNSCQSAKKNSTVPSESRERTITWNTYSESPVDTKPAAHFYHWNSYRFTFRVLLCWTA